MDFAMIRDLFLCHFAAFHEDNNGWTDGLCRHQLNFSAIYVVIMRILNKLPHQIIKMVHLYPKKLSFRTNTENARKAFKISRKCDVKLKNEEKLS